MDVVWILALVSIPALWLIVLLRRASDADLALRLRRLEKALIRLDAQVAALRAAPAAPVTPAAVEAPAAPPPQAEPVVMAPAIEPAPVSRAPETAAPPEAARTRTGIEEMIMRRWAVWLGAVALALGGIFLVKYSIEQGYIGPAVRIAAGTVLGLGLVATSEIARRPSLTAAGPIAAADYVPAALAAGGTVILFASFYAGYALYDLIPALLAFVLLASVSMGAAVLSLWHGMLLALLGLAGAYVVPLLVATESPSVPRLLAYVLAVTAGCVTLARWREWPWLGWIALAGSSLWTLAAIAHEPGGNGFWIGAYLLLSAPLFLALAGTQGTALAHRSTVAWSGAVAAALLTLVLAMVSRFDATSLTVAWMLTALFVAVAVRWPPFDRLPWIAAALHLLILATWVFMPPVAGVDAFTMLLILPPASALGSYIVMSGAVAALAGIGGFVMVSGAPRPDRWALLSAVTPPLTLAVVYWRVEQLAASLPWAAAAFVLAVVDLAAFEYLAPRRAKPGVTNAFAYYALATTVAIALALTLSLRLGWLSIALALQLPAMAWLYERTAVRAMRHFALALAGIVLVRLLLNPSILDYPLGTMPLLNAILYTYGVPAAAFAIASAWFRRSADDLLVTILEAGALVLSIALISLEIRHFAGGGRLDRGPYDLLEQSLQTDAWLLVAYGMLKGADRTGRWVLEIGWQVIAGAALAHLLLLQCLTSNPLIAQESVGSAPFFDVLVLAYLVPAIMAWLFFRALSGRGATTLSSLAGVLALALTFLYVTLEVRHLFHGRLLATGYTSTGEWYTYSAAWLAYGAALLAGGIIRRDSWLRRAGLLVGGLVAVKAFGSDMAALTGLYRAASFLGLGASIIAIVWFYQRIVGLSDAKAPPSERSF